MISLLNGMGVREVRAVCGQYLEAYPSADSPRTFFVVLIAITFTMGTSPSWNGWADPECRVNPRS